MASPLCALLFPVFRLGLKQSQYNIAHIHAHGGLDEGEEHGHVLEVEDIWGEGFQADEHHNGGEVAVDQPFHETVQRRGTVLKVRFGDAAPNEAEYGTAIQRRDRPKYAKQSGEFLKIEAAQDIKNTGSDNQREVVKQDKPRNADARREGRCGGIGGAGVGRCVGICHLRGHSP